MSASGLNLGRIHDRSTTRLHRERASGDDVTLDFNAHIRGRSSGSTPPRPGSVVVCLDEMGPQSARSYPGRRVVKPAPPKAQRAKQEIDYGRRGVAGHVFGAFQPTKGDALTFLYVARTTANWVDFLGKVEAWINPSV